MDVTKNIHCLKGEDHITVTRWLKKFCSGYKNLDNQARSSSPKSMDSEAMLEAIEANSVSNM